jgi:hypothetical protein
MTTWRSTAIVSGFCRTLVDGSTINRAVAWTGVELIDRLANANSRVRVAHLNDDEYKSTRRYKLRARGNQSGLNEKSRQVGGIYKHADESPPPQPMQISCDVRFRTLMSDANLQRSPVGRLCVHEVKRNSWHVR